MKFVARKPRDDVNVSDTHPLAEAGLLVVGLSLVFLGFALFLIFLIEIFLTFISPEDEAQIFSTYLPSDLVMSEEADPRLEETNELLQRLAAHWPDAPYEFRLEIDQSADPNAMAFPGGLIVVTAGLLDRAETENELAFVLGHELGHYHNRDHIRMLGRGVILSLAFAIITGSDGLGLTIADLTLLSFSREQETDADEFGLSLVQAEYGHVNDAWGFFEELIEDGGEDLGVITYLSTHPATDERIEDIRDHAGEQGWPLEGPVRQLPE